MSYEKYGIPRELVERVKAKLKHPDVKERAKVVLEGVAKEDLQNPAKVKTLLARLTCVLNEPVSDVMANRIVQFVIDQKIDPNNTFHLIRLWSMFR